jgi:hypothetical protein
VAQADHHLAGRGLSRCASADHHDEIVAFNGELIPVTGTAKWMDKWLKRNGEKP